VEGGIAVARYSASQPNTARSNMAGYRYRKCVACWGYGAEQDYGSGKHH